ncbi:hypothetical protein O6H91_12G052800 [Diphasiastrum complanatum]|uniref:Uncharacterized protein n=1 Tax=Diphasiastrum complanatum TaxID=34168 RepID=A0ACC2C1S2_DIPCM|nr:hypothetical protein O6H91_12G052800 [Diphasiastrum complanatum]
MALKFLNKKGWHTGSLRNIENVWKAEQKHEAEQKKLEELRKQIHEEREAEEFRLLQEQAGLAPRQERLDFLYDSGLAVGKPSTDDYLLGKPVEQPKDESTLAKQAAMAPGALFAEEKPRSANDTWRKLHSDPLFSIRQQEQAALARIRNNPVKMEMIRKEVESKKKMKEEKHSLKAEKKERRKKRKRTKTKEQSGSRQTSSPRESSENEGGQVEAHKHGDTVERPFKDRKVHAVSRTNDPERRQVPNYMPSKGDNSSLERANGGYSDMKHASASGSSRDFPFKGRYQPKPLSEEERNARLLEMQADAELHEEQRWKRLQRASAEDAVQEKRDSIRTGRSFIDDTNKSVYGAGKGGSSTVEESIRRRTHYRERHSADGHANAFRR